MGACFIVYDGYVAVIAIVCLFPSVDFVQKVVRDGLVVDDGDHRDVTVHWGRFLFSHFVTKNKGENKICLPF